MGGMLGRRLGLPVLVLALAVAGCDGEDEKDVVMPEDPCALLSATDVAAAIDGSVEKVERVPSIDQIVAAQDRGGTREDVPVDDRRLCSYTTTSPLAAITVFVPKPSDDGAELFRSARRRDDEGVSSVGDNAYLSGGASLRVLVGGASFSIGIQHPHASNKVRAVLTNLDKKAVDRLRS